MDIGRGRRHALWGFVVSALVVSGLQLALQPAYADTAPPIPNDPTNPQTVSADPLPTVQIGNGVVWSQAVIGNTVYAAGEFSTARPAGAAPGTNEVARSNLLAYDVRTGVLLDTWTAGANGAVYAIKASPDGTRLYIAGAFTTVNGLTRRRVAALNPTTGAVITNFNPNPDAAVRALAVTNSTVYFGGGFGIAGGQARSRLAAVNVSDGSLLPWAPAAAGGSVKAMVMTPDGSKVVIGGQFTTLNGGSNPGYGFGAVDPVTGANTAWDANTVIRDAGANAGIDTLTADGDSVYAGGFTFGGGGNFEGAARINSAGSILWLDDCHGDTYDTYSLAGVVYKVGHMHYCGNIPGGYPQPEDWIFYRGLAFSKEATGVARPEYLGYTNYAGRPDPSILPWYPDLEAGTFTGQTQGAWSLAGNADYVVAGGEFPTAGQQPQQGLVRYAVRSLSPNNIGPEDTFGKADPTVTSPGPGEALISWRTNYDRDNANLTYKVIKETDVNNPIYTVSRATKPWDRPYLSFLATGETPGATVRYRIFAEDPLGNVSKSNFVSVVISGTGTATDTYAKSVLADGPQSYWRLDEPSGSTMADFTGLDPMTASGSVSRNQSGAIAGHAATTFSGTSSQSAATSIANDAPYWSSVEAWFKTSTLSGGRIVGYSNARTGSSASNKYDRMIWMSGFSGQLNFGVRQGSSNVVLSSGTGYNNNQWHHVVGTIGDNGMNFYVDGVRVGQRTDTRTGAAYSGYWRIGGDGISSSWSPQPTSSYFAGTIDEVAVYRHVLSGNSVRSHYIAAGKTVAGPALPTDNYGKGVYDSDPSLFWRLGETSGSTAADSSLNGASGGYQNSPTLGGTSAVGLVGDRSVTLDGSNDYISQNTSIPSPSVYSEELWFKTTTTQGGRLIGFGNGRTSSSSTVDRQVFMTNAGKLRFGVNNGAQQVIESSSSYNNGQWHYLVAVQGPSGMRLYVDGLLAASGNVFNATDFSGYWRVGGDNLSGWASRPTSDYFAGSIDEVAVYSRALSSDDVAAHFTKAGGVIPNNAPVAAFTPTVTNMVVAFDGSASTDSDGSITSYAWDFGDGQTGSTVNPSHSYATPGTYPVTLTVTDNRGATASVSHNVSPVNPLPTAAFTFTSTNKTATFDSSGSSDPNGVISSYAWNFGDGQTSTSANPSHTYAALGTYTVQLTVTDDNGGQHTVSHQVDLSNVAPTAAFTSAVDNLVVTFNSSGSVDPDGTIASRSWDFGDGQTSTAANPVHTYAAKGNFTVVLTVTDNDGSTGSISHVVTTTNNGAPVTLASDDFERTVSGGWGNAVVGGAWTRTGPTSNYAVNGGTGAMIMPTAGSGPSMTLASVSASDSDATVKVTFDKIANGGGSYVSLGSRQVGTSGYRAKIKVGIDGRITLYLVRTISNADTTLATVLLPADVTLTPDAALDVRLQTEGTNPTTLRARAWLDGTPEPSTWQATATDSNASLQVPGGIILVNYLTGSATNAPVVARYDGLLVQTLGGTPTPNQAPVAAFTSSIDHLDATFNSSGSSDPDGLITGYAWDFGDGQTSTATNPSHSYATGGDYTVSLTVTDNDSASTSISHVVTATNPPGPEVFASDDFERTFSNGWGNAVIGGAWTRTGSQTNYAVTGGHGNMTMPTAGSGPTMTLNSVSVADTDATVKVSFDKIADGGGSYVSLGSRQVGTSGYRAKLKVGIDGRVTMYLVRTISNADTTLATLLLPASTTLTPSAQLQIRLQTQGFSPTTLRAKAWLVGSAEPATWQLTATDSNASLQAPGGIILVNYLTGSATNFPVIASYDDLFVTEP